MKEIPWKEIPKTKTGKLVYKVSIIEETISKPENKVTRRVYANTKEFHSLEELTEYVGKQYYTTKFVNEKQDLQRLEEGEILSFINDKGKSIDILRMQITKTTVNEVELTIEGLPIFKIGPGRLCHS